MGQFFKFIYLMAALILLSSCGQGFKTLNLDSIDLGSTNPTPVPTPTPLPSPNPSPTPTPIPTPVPTPTPIPSPNPSPTPGDTTPPTATLSTTTTSPTRLASISISVRFSENVTGLALTDFALTNATVSNLQGSGNQYSLTLTPTLNGQFSIQLPANRVFDLANNPNTVASNTVSLLSDRTSPQVNLSTITTSPTQIATFSVLATFTEAVSGFAATDITVINATVSNFTGSGTSYSFDLTAISSGLVSVSVAANTSVDLASNPNTASNTLSVDYQPPTCNNTLTLAWFSPTENEDNTPVSPLGGYRLSYGSQSGLYSTTVDIQGGATETYTLTNLSPGNYYMAIKAYTTANVESAYSSEISTTIAPCSATRIDLTTGKILVTKLVPTINKSILPGVDRKIASEL